MNLSRRPAVAGRRIFCCARRSAAAHAAAFSSRREHEFDVLHFHVDLVHFPFFEAIAERTVTTLHGRLDMSDLDGAYPPIRIHRSPQSLNPGNP